MGFAEWIHIADVCKRREDWVRRTVRAYNEDGPEGLVDGRQENGSDHHLDEGQRAALATALGGDPPDGGLWTARKVTQWIKDHTGAVLSEHTGGLYMVRAGFTRQVPRPKHPDADEEAQQAFKKGGSRAVFETSFEGFPTPRSRSGRRTKGGSG